MNKFHPFNSLWVMLRLAFVGIVVSGILWVSCDQQTDITSSPQEETALGLSSGKQLEGVSAIQLQRVMAIQNRHTKNLMDISGVVATATGLTEDGKLAIKVYTKFAGMKAIPDNLDDVRQLMALPSSLEGIPVIVEYTGEIKALKGPPPNGEPDPTTRFDRPVPIGVSTGHPAITAGTIGCRVTDGTDVYALSNNHVYADENNAALGDSVIQPGTYDGGALPADFLGTLDDYEQIQFGNTGTCPAVPSTCNEIDAAIALSSTALLGNATPSNGYGLPKSNTIAASVNLRVMKYGRTTVQTKGRVDAINAIVDVGYDTGVARYINQIVIVPGNFSAGGDSGSLIVVEKGSNSRRPVGLLFAGSSSHTIANPIDPVLTRFGVTVDGE